MNRRLFVFAVGFAQVSNAFAVRSGPLRREAPNMVVLHSTGGPTCDRHGKPIWVAAGELQDNMRTIEAHPRLGIHYMIGRDGTIVSSVPEEQVAHHVFRFSHRSVGIELVNDGDGVDVYPQAQLLALIALLRELKGRYPIGPAGIVRHSDLDTGRMPCAPSQRRKVDPGPAFPFDWVVRQTMNAP